MTEKTTTLTEFEENVSFDADDPDFAPSSSVVRDVLRDVRRFVKFDVNNSKCIVILLIVLISGVS